MADKVIEVVLSTEETKTFQDFLYTNPNHAHRVGARELEISQKTLATCRDIHELTGLRVKVMANYSGRRGGTLFEFSKGVEPKHLIEVIQARAAYLQMV